MVISEVELTTSADKTSRAIQAPIGAATLPTLSIYTIDKEKESSKWEAQMTGQLPTTGVRRDPDVAPHPLQGLLVRGVHPGTSIM